MSSRSEVLIRILALLQRKTLIETKSRTLKCLKRHYSTVRSMKNVAALTEDGEFALVFLPPPRADPRELAFFLPWMANSRGWGLLSWQIPRGGEEKRGKCPVLRQQCNIFY